MHLLIAFEHYNAREGFLSICSPLTFQQITEKQSNIEIGSQQARTILNFSGILII